MSHFLATLHMTIDKLHHFAWVETMILTEIDKETSESSLRRSRTALAALATSFRSLATLLLGRRLDDFRCISIVLEEATELTAHHLLEYIFLIHILEMATNLCHERRYLLFIHIDFLYLVDGTEELLGANLLRSRQVAIDKLLAYLLFLAFIQHTKTKTTADGIPETPASRRKFDLVHT